MSSINWTDSIGAASLDNAKQAPASRFANWNPSNKPFGAKSATLETGALNTTAFRDDLTVAFDVKDVPNTDMALMLRLQMHLKRGGVVTLTTDEPTIPTFGDCQLAPGADVVIQLSNRAKLWYTVSTVLRGRNVSGPPVGGSDGGTGDGGDGPTPIIALIHESTDVRFYDAGLTLIATTTAFTPTPAWGGDPEKAITLCWTTRGTVWVAYLASTAYDDHEGDSKPGVMIWRELDPSDGSVIQSVTSLFQACEDLEGFHQMAEIAAGAATAGLAIDADPLKFQTTGTVAYDIDGVRYIKAAESGLTFSDAYVVSANKFGAIRVQVNAAGAISTVAVSSPQAYDSANEALSDLPGAETGNAPLGYIAISANGINWTANASNMTDADDLLTASFNDSGLPLITAGIAVDANPLKFKTTVTATYIISGTPYTKAPETGLVFSDAHVVSANKFGVILVQIDTAGVITTKVSVSPQAYDSAAFALTQMASPDSGNARLGYIQISANGTDWTANASNLTAGSGLLTVSFSDESLPLLINWQGELWPLLVPSGNADSATGEYIYAPNGQDFAINAAGTFVVMAADELYLFDLADTDSPALIHAFVDGGDNALKCYWPVWLSDNTILVFVPVLLEDLSQPAPFKANGTIYRLNLDGDILQTYTYDPSVFPQTYDEFDVAELDGGLRGVGASIAQNKLWLYGENAGAPYVLPIGLTDGVSAAPIALATGGSDDDTASGFVVNEFAGYTG